MADVQLNSNIEANTSYLNPIWTAGIYRSTNSGDDWSPINGGLLSNFTNGGSIRNILIDPTNSNRLYAATSEGFFLTVDALSPDPTWDNVVSDLNYDSQLRGLEFKPGNSSVLYASGTDIYRSLNSGLTWQSITTNPNFPGLDFSNLPDNFEVERINVAVTPDNPEALFAYIVGKYDYVNGSISERFPRAYIYKFTGTQWLELEEKTTIVIDDTPGVGDIVGHNWLGISVSPIDEDLVIYGHVNVRARRPNGTFVNITGSIGQGIHADVHDVKFAPETNNPRIFAATHGGVSEGTLNGYPQYITSSSTTWLLKCDGLRTSTLWTYDLSKSGKAYLIGHQDNGTSYFEDGFTNWRKIKGSDGYTAAISNFFNPIAYYGSLVESSILPFQSSYSSVLKPKSLEYSSQTAKIPKTFPNFHINTTGKDYFVFSEIYEKIADDGDNWDDVWSFASDVGHISIFNSPGENVNDVWRHQLSEVAASQVDPNIVYVAVGGFDLGVDFEDVSDVRPFLLKSETGLWSGTPDPNNQKFFDITENLPIISQAIAVPPCITGLAVDPENPDKVWITFTGFYADKKVWKSDDGGQSWENDDPNGSLANLPVNGIVIQDGTRIGNSDHRIFIATDAGVYYKEPGETCWAKYGLIPNVRVTELKTITCDNTIHAATWGRGLWKTEMPPRTRSLATITINENTTWDDPRFFEQNLTIKTGVTLTIKSAVYMPESADINVEPGGTLIVDGGTITSSCSNVWSGIKLWGNYNLPQTASNQGRVIIKNNATIENASNAITTWNPGNWATTGGIIQATNSTFRNNRRSVEFMAYQNTQSNGYIAPNRSYFKNCTFETDDDYLIPNEGNMNMITMYKVNGVKILGCDFIYNRTVTNYTDLKGAIFTSDANFRVDNSCNTILSIGQPCPTANTRHSTFTGFNKAIHVTGASWNVGPEIKDAVFSENMQGINLDAVVAPAAIFNEFTVGNNQFSVIDNDDPNFHLGIKVNNCDEFIVEENEFTGSNVYGWTTHGVYSYDDSYSAFSNEIYKNEYSDVSSASIASGKHADPTTTNSFVGLRFICNQNQNNTNDFEVRPFEGIEVSEISNYQNGGYPAIPAGNTFSTGNNFDNIFGHLDFYSNAGYEYLANVNDSDPSSAETYITPPGTITVTTTPLQNACATNYPAPGGGISPGLTYGKFKTEREAYENLYYSYLQLIDEGNTQAMITEIDLSWPNDAWQLHYELMARSPYNSEIVLIAAADKGILTHGMLLEILLANPDALRSGDVINHLHYKISNPLPQYMIDILIAASRNPGTARSLMEKNLSNLHLDMIRSHKRVTHQHLNDSVLGFHPDTLIKYFSSVKTLAGRYQQVYALTGMNQYDNAYAVIDTISVNYKLNNDQISELNNTEDFVDFLKNIHDDGRNEAQLDSIEIMDLKDIADAKPGGNAAERAENILCFFYGQCADELGAPKNNAVKIKKPRIPLEALEEALNTVKIAPNPGDSYVEFEYSIFKSSKENILRIVDIQGKPVHSWRLGSNQKGIKVLDTRKLSNGVYFFELLQEGKKLKSGKFIVQH